MTSPIASSSPALSFQQHPVQQEYPFTPVPPPWTLHGEVYWMILKSLPKEKLPPGTYDPLEQLAEDDPTDFAHPSRFVGRLGLVWVVRYHDSPVGPYDELIYVPGEFVQPDNSKAHRITRIYVSSKESVWNGRRNWNIPKHLARFTFTTASDGRTTLVEVFDPYDTSLTPHPFFAAQFVLQRWVPAIPFTTRWIRSNPTPHPPLKQGKHPEESASEDLANIDSSTHLPSWRAVTQETKGPARVVWWQPAPPREGGRIAPGEYGDGIGFPKIKIWSFGLSFGEGTEVTFGEPLPVRGPE